MILLKNLLPLITILFLIPIILAQPKIELKHIGYGKTPQEIHVQLSNTGNTTLTNIEIYVDNEKIETIKTSLSPKKIIEYILYLTPGKHFVEANTTEGAYDSFEINVSAFTTTTVLTENEETKSFLEQKKTEIIIGMFIIFFGIVIWVLTRRPRLSLD